jgi:hypothetical protein
MNKAQHALKNNKKLRVFLLFLSLSFLFWMLIKLSKNYTATIKVNLTYVDLPENKMLQADPISTIKVTINSGGFRLLKYTFSNRDVTLSLKNIKKKNSAIFYYLGSDIIKDIEDSFSKADVKYIEPDTLYFSLGKSISKKVKVEPNLSIQYKSGYNLLGSLKIDPEYITISGPEAQVSSVNLLTTEPIQLNNISDSINKNIAIAKIKDLNKINYSAELINVRGKVEKFTEMSLEVPFRILNAPSNRIKTFPNKVKIVFQIGLSDFNRVTEGDFDLVCDFSKVKIDEVNYLVPEVLNKPNIVKEIKIIPNKIEFLIEK